MEILPDKFDGPPTVLPLPDDVPAEIPRLIFGSKDKQWQLEMGSSRLTYRWIQQTENKQVLPDHFCPEFIGFVNRVLPLLEHPRVGRIALVWMRYLLETDPATVLCGTFFSGETLLKDALANQRSFELHSLRRTTIAEKFEVNSWVRFKSGQLTLPKTPVRPIILVEQDVNTLPEKADSASHSTEEIAAFYASAAKESDTRFRSFLER
jgi:hypothetical protein